ncbi:LysR substrate-binding domain-containing protein [Pseudomonas sp. S2_H10]
MNRNDLRRVDMNLLVIFETLMFERNLTRAGEKLFLGQPAVSASLAKLRDLSVKILRGDDRPGQLTLDEFCERPHALVSFSGDLSGAIDNDLARIGRSRRVVLAVPQFAGLRALLAGTDMLATVPDYAASALIDGSSQLRADDAPFEINLSELSMVWNGVNDNDPAERWLRSKIAQHMAAPLSAH